MATELVLFIGLQASGKTTFYAERFIHTHVRVSLDQLRTRPREKRFFDLCMESGLPLVIDNTNPTRADRRRYMEPARAAGYAVHAYFFRSRVAECLSRNDARPEARRVPHAGVLGTSARLEMPSRDEGFDVLRFVTIVAGSSVGAGGSRFQVEEWRDEVR